VKLPCETGVWYLLPMLRAELAKELLKLGLTQKEVSEKLGITQAAVSQYISKKRGRNIKLDKKSKKSIIEIAKKIACNSDQTVVEREICRMCVRARKSKVLEGM